MQPPESVPVLILIFNRPEKVRALIEALTHIRPSRIYIAADGPRAFHQTDSVQCAEARRIAQDIPWPCKILTRFSDENLGVDPAVETGITWFFDHETEGVILEDDCIPTPDFFRFCAAMLERYRDDERMMMVSGNNFQDGIPRGDGNYYFSQYPNTWGWASWRRAWKRYDRLLADLPKFKQEESIKSIRPYPEEQRYWLRYFRKLRAGTYSAWDAKWIFAVWNARGLSVVPSVNLVRNIGFDDDATHTRSGDKNAAETTSSMEDVFQAPTTREADEAADRYVFQKIYRATIISRIQSRLTNLFS